MEKPILFSESMIKAILRQENPKTVTRRIIKPQPVQSSGTPVWWLEKEFEGASFIGEENLRSHLFHNVYGDKGTPYGAVYADGSADKVWVRETWRHYKKENRTAYRADGEENVTPLLTWQPSIFMPRWASRITLEITDVRVERLQEASLASLIAEGCPVEYLPENCNGMSHAVYGWFQSLWDGINCKRGYGWDSNPWVWVIEFKRA